MKFLFIFLLISNVNLSCVQSRRSTYDIKCVKITQITPLLGTGGLFNEYDTLVTSIYSKNDQRLIHSSFFYETYNGSESKKTISEVRWHDIVYTIGNKYGILIDQAHGQRIVSVDSILKKEWINKFDINGIFNTYECEYITRKSETGEVEKYSYRFKHKLDTAISGTMDFWFNNNIKTDYSLSKKLDSIHGAKLYKVHIINNPTFMKQYNIHIDKLDQEWKLEIMPIFDYNYVIELFKKDKGL